MLLFLFKTPQSLASGTNGIITLCICQNGSIGFSDIWVDRIYRNYGVRNGLPLIFGQATIIGHTGIFARLVQLHTNSMRVWREHEDVGFRVAVIPEPSTLLLIGLGSLMLRKRK